MTVGFIFYYSSQPMHHKPFQLGELEIAVLDDLWSSGSSDAKTVHRRVGGRRKITLNTVQSTLDRLYRKTLLSREKVSHAFVYTPQLSKSELSSRLIDGLMQSTLGNDRQSMLAAFVSLAADANALSELEALIAVAKRSTQERSK